MCFTCRSMTCSSFDRKPSPRSLISWSAVTIGASGLRSSCPSIARNASLARFACSAASRAACSSSTRFCSVRSRITFEYPRSTPASSRTAPVTTWAQNRLPSLRTRQPSTSIRPSYAAAASSRSQIPARASSSG